MDDKIIRAAFAGDADELGKLVARGVCIEPKTGATALILPLGQVTPNV